MRENELQLASEKTEAVILRASDGETVHVIPGKHVHEKNPERIRASKEKRKIIRLMLESIMGTTEREMRLRQVVKRGRGSPCQNVWFFKQFLGSPGGDRGFNWYVKPGESNTIGLTLCL